jgi:hypothetical protein
MKKCEKCNIDHIGEFGSGRFCSRMCANSRIHSEDVKKRIANSLKKEKIIKKCIICNTEFQIKSSCKNKKCCSSKCAGINKRKKKLNRIVKRSDLYDMTYIYTLDCPITGIPKYVGKSNNPLKRIKSHIHECNRKYTKKNNWIKKLINNNTVPILSVLDHVKFYEWQFWEQFYINLLQSWGFILKNESFGGEGGSPFLGKKHSTETKYKMSINAINRLNKNKNL